MPMPNDIDLTIRHVPYEVFARLEAAAGRQGKSVEQFLLQQAEEAASQPFVEPFDAEAWIAKRRAAVAAIAARGPVLKPGETLKDLAREGLRDA